MRDDQTGSEWLHYTGECIMGPLAGQSLEVLPSTMLTWQGFRELHPDATVIEHARALWRRIMGRLVGRRDVPLLPLPGMFRRTMRELDRRLDNHVVGLGVVIGKRSLVGGVREAGARFYPFKAVRDAGAVNDSIAGTPVVVAFDPAVGVAVAFLATLDGATLQFERTPSGRLRDIETGTEFDFAGRSIGGRFEGKRLTPASAVASRWYGFSQSYPGTSIWPVMDGG